MTNSSIFFAFMTSLSCGSFQLELIVPMGPPRLQWVFFCLFAFSRTYGGPSLGVELEL